MLFFAVRPLMLLLRITWYIFWPVFKEDSTVTILGNLVKFLSKFCFKKLLL
jgi:hypothetical protein